MKQVLKDFAHHNAKTPSDVSCEQLAGGFKFREARRFLSHD
jgi:hypothetical protein